MFVHVHSLFFDCHLTSNNTHCLSKVITNNYLCSLLVCRNNDSFFTTLVKTNFSSCHHPSSASLLFAIVIFSFHLRVHNICFSFFFQYFSLFCALLSNFKARNTQHHNYQRQWLRVTPEIVKIRQLFATLRDAIHHLDAILSPLTLLDVLLNVTCAFVVVLLAIKYLQDIVNVDGIVKLRILPGFQSMRLII